MGDRPSVASIGSVKLPASTTIDVKELEKPLSVKRMIALEHEKERKRREEQKYATKVVTVCDCKLYARRDLASGTLALLPGGQIVYSMGDLDEYS